MTLNPLFVHKSVCNPSIEWVEAHCNLLSLDIRIAKGFAPVIQVMNLDAPATHNFRGSPRCRGHGENQEPFIVRNHSEPALASFGQPSEKSLPWTLPQCRVIGRVVDLIEEFADPVVQFAERPHRESLGVDRFRDLPDISHDQGVSPQVVNELGIGHTEHALAQGSKPCFRWWPHFLRTFIVGQQRLKISAPNSFPPSTTTICGRRLWRRTHSRRTIMHER